MEPKYSGKELEAISFFKKYEFTDGILELLYEYIEKCKKFKVTHKTFDETEAQIAFMPLNTQLKQWHVSGAYSEETYWEGVNLLKEIFYD